MVYEALPVHFQLRLHMYFPRKLIIYNNCFLMDDGSLPASHEFLAWVHSSVA